MKANDLAMLTMVLLFLLVILISHRLSDDALAVILAIILAGAFGTPALLLAIYALGKATQVDKPEPHAHPGYDGAHRRRPDAVHDPRVRPLPRRTRYASALPPPQQRDITHGMWIYIPADEVTGTDADDSADGW